MTDGDFGFDLGFRLDVINSVEQQNLFNSMSSRKARRAGIEPPRPRVEAIRTVDMSSSNAWAKFAGTYRLTRTAALDHDQAKAELKALMPEDAREATGHGVKAKRSKSGAVSFELLAEETNHATV